MFATSCIAGNLTADPELKHVGANSTALVKFTIAVNDRSSGDDKAYFFSVQAWGNLAEMITEVFKKGDRIAVSCDMRQERWQDKTTGQNRSREVHNVRDIMFPSRGEGDKVKRKRVAGKSPALGAAYGTEPQPKREMTTHQLMDHLPLDDDDDIPF